MYKAVLDEAVRFDWDEHKTAHIERHRVTREEFEQALANGTEYSSVTAWAADRKVRAEYNKKRKLS